MVPQVPRLQKPCGNCRILVTHPAPEFNSLWSVSRLTLCSLMNR